MEVGAYLSASQKKRKQKRTYIILSLSILGICFLVFGIIWTIFGSSVFKIQSITVRGNTTIASDDIIALIHSSVLKSKNPIVTYLGDNNILAWPKTLSAEETASLPQLLNISLEKYYMTRSVVINVTQRKPFAVWCFMSRGSNATMGDSDITMTYAIEETGESCSWFSDDGIMFEKGFDAEGGVLMAIHDYSQNALPLDSPILPDRFISNLVSIVNVLRGSGLNIKEIMLNDISLEEIRVTTYDGPTILFSLRFPADADLLVIKNIMTKPGFQKIQYLDLRTEARAYYK